MLKVTGGAMPGLVVGLLPISVCAAAGDGDREETSPLNRDDLSLYATPPPPRDSRCVVEPESGELEQSVSAVRGLVEPHAARCMDAYNTVKPKVDSVLQCGTDTYTYLKNPPKDFYPRVGIIGFTGLLGLLLARGSRIRRVVYPLGLMTVCSSLYYPKQAVAIARSTGDTVYDRAVRSYAAVERMVKPQGRGGEEAGDSGNKP